MTLTKHKIIKIRIKDTERFNLDTTSQKAVNVFLANNNYIYINHSITVFNENITEYDIVRSENKYIVISIIYKDLTATDLDLDNTSEKIKKVVKKDIENGETLIKPIYETEFDKKIRKLTTNKPNAR